MTPVLNWIRSNVVIVIFVALMLAAAIALPLVAGSMNAAVVLDMNARRDKGRELDSVKSEQIDQADGPRTVTLHEDVVEKYRQYTEQRKLDAEQLHKIALEHNHKGRDVLMKDLFPQMKSREREVLPRKYHDRLVQAYDELLTEIRAGSPPPMNTLAEELAQAESAFRINALKKGETDALTPEEADQLRAELSNVRLTRIGQAAQNMGVYASRSALRVPEWVQGKMPSLATLFDWQWQYWIIQDVLLAVHEANKPFPSVVTAPVKRVISITLLDGVAVSSSDGSSGGGGGTSLGGAMPGLRGRPPAGGRGSAPPVETPPEEPSDDGSGGAPPPSRPASSVPGAAPDAGAAPPLGKPIIDLTAAAPVDYKVSYTGRKTNPLYDVRKVELRIVAETAKVPQLIQALSQRNLMTVLDVDMIPASPFEAVRMGFFFGDEPVSYLVITLETIWLREWTAPFMPQEYRAALDIKSEAAGAAARDAG